MSPDSDPQGIGSINGEDDDLLLLGQKNTVSKKRNARRRRRCNSTQNADDGKKFQSLSYELDETEVNRGNGPSKITVIDLHIEYVVDIYTCMCIGNL